jgi:hypothetical protein
VDTTQRKNARNRREQLLTLVNAWDPVGLLEAGAPRDEYDRLIDGLLGVLDADATEAEITAFLEREIQEHFEVASRGTSEFARRAITWFRMP